MSLTAQQRDVVSNLRRQLPSLADVSDEDLLHLTEETHARATAEFVVACREVVAPAVRQLESACLRLDGWLRRLRG